MILFPNEVMRPPTTAVNLKKKRFIQTCLGAEEQDMRKQKS